MNKAFSMLPLILALAGLSSTAQAQAPAGDAAKGATKAAMCIGCHGIVGYQASFPEVYKVPMIAGQNAKYLMTSLQAYAKGDRKHPTMRGIAQSLSDQDMADLAAYYQELGKGSVTPPPVQPTSEMPAALKDRLTVCVACHGANFSTPIDPSYPKIAGQKADYLAASLRSYQTDGNANIGRNNASMRAQVVQESNGQQKHVFSPAEIREVSKYLSSLPGELQTVSESRFR